MKTPKFWKNINLFSVLFYPLGWLYFLLYKFRCVISKHPYESKIPVICVGNLTVGGSGKTPLAIELAKILRDKEKSFCFLSKGYGGNINKMVKKVEKNDSSEVVGDEPLLLAEYGDTYVSKNRVCGLKFINENCKYDYIIMDDGLQNPTFLKNKIIVVINGEYGLGNSMFLPAGPLRSRLKDIKKIDLVVINGKDIKNITKICEKYKLPYTVAKIRAKLDNVDFNRDYVAFCGLGLPEKFKKTLDENKIRIKDFVVFGDHHNYTKNDIEKLKKNNQNNFITTKKDWIKLDLENKKNIDYLDIFLEIENKNLIEDIIK